MPYKVDALYNALYNAHRVNSSVAIRYFYGLGVSHIKVNAYIPDGMFVHKFANAYGTPKYSYIAAYMRINILRFVKPRPLCSLPHNYIKLL